MHGWILWHGEVVQMEIITLLKANLRHKKGSFLSILILMIIISMALTAIFSVQDNVYDSICGAHDRIHSADIQCQMDINKMTPELLKKVEEHPMVDRVEPVTAIPSQNIKCGDKDYASSAFFQKLPAGCRLFDDAGTGYADKTPELKQGEIYISRGMKTSLSCEKGDKLTASMRGNNYEFRIAGFVEEPMLGSSVIGWKNVYICDEDYEKMYEQEERLADAENGICTISLMLNIYKADDCSLTNDKFARQLNLDTGILDMCFGSMTRDQSIRYTYLFAETIGNVLLAFVVLLLAAELLIMCHSISMEIEMEYTTLGILKSQGFTTGRIRLIFVLQYMIGWLTGAGIGTACAIPLIRILGNVFIPITGIVSRQHISIGSSGLILSGMLLVSVGCIVWITRRVARISPVQAISGGNKDIYFESRLMVPINKKTLSATLALRQFTSNKKQYIGIAAVVSLLMYFMATMMIMGNVMDTDSAWETMGETYTNLQIEFKEDVEDTQLHEIEKLIEESTDIKDKVYYGGNDYYSINGEKIMASIYGSPEHIKGLTGGRIPKYDNEIVITQIAADNMGLDIGDKVTVGYRGEKEEYVICGLNQHTSDTGNNFSITVDAARKLNPKQRIVSAGYNIGDYSGGSELAEKLNKEYGEEIVAEYTPESVDETIQIAINAMTAVVYIFSAVFSAVVVSMVCARAFMRERRDIGIYKAVGFTTFRLRSQFVLRFLLVAVPGCVIGGVLAGIFAGPMLSGLLRIIGISSFMVTVNFYTFAVPCIMIGLCITLFSYISSRKLKRVSTTELITE